MSYGGGGDRGVEEEATVIADVTLGTIAMTETAEEVAGMTETDEMIGEVAGMIVEVAVTTVDAMTAVVAMIDQDVTILVVVETSVVVAETLVVVAETLAADPAVLTDQHRQQRQHNQQQQQHQQQQQQQQQHQHHYHHYPFVSRKEVAEEVVWVWEEDSAITAINLVINHETVL
eukprot:gene4459-38_t